jgi:hypothetical protein
LTVTVWFATVNVPLRAPPVFAATLIATVPLPVPLAPEVIDNQEAFVVAVHVHPAAAVTAIGPAVPPPAPIDTVVGLIEGEHDEAA